MKMKNQVMYWAGKLSKAILIAIVVDIFALVGWNAFYSYVFPIGCIITGNDDRMTAYRYRIEGSKYDGNFIDDFRRGFSLHPGYAIEIEFPMIYYYGKEGFVVLNQESPVIKILKAENSNYSRYWWEDKGHKYVNDVIICEKISDLTPKEQGMYYKLKCVPKMQFPNIEYPGKYDFKAIYYNIMIPRPYEEERRRNKGKI